MKVLATSFQHQLSGIDEQIAVEPQTAAISSSNSPPSSSSSSSISSGDDTNQPTIVVSNELSSDSEENEVSDDNNNKIKRSSYEAIDSETKGASAWRKIALSRGQRAKSRGDIFAALMKETFSSSSNNTRSGSIDFTSVIQSQMNKLNANPATSCSQVHKQPDPYGSQDNIKSPWDLLCKIINCKVAFKKQFNGKKYNWIQLAGHAGRFRPGEREGYILKSMDELERRCLEMLRDDVLAPFVPTIDQTILDPNDSKYYTEMQDLLYSFNNPCIMDIKIGVRTFLESDTDEKETKPRHDLYLKLIELAPNEPTAEEHVSKAITKRRYMSWRERSTCSATLGFRIEAIKKSHVSEKEFYKVKEKKEVQAHIRSYTENKKNILRMYRDKLISLKEALERSEFFYNHELIGSSLLFVHDMSKVGVWMIDFGKTRPLPVGVRITHRDAWLDGNHEDGYLIGIQNLIDIFTEMI